MKREWLKELGIADDLVDKIMAENGKDIEKFKTELSTKTEEAKNAQEQLITANKEIESYKSMDIEAIKKAADDYKIKYEAAEADSAKKIQDLKFDHIIENTLVSAKAKNVKAVKALLNLDALKLEGDKVVGIDEQLAALQKDNDYLFDTEKAPGGTGGSKGAGGKITPNPTEVNYGATLGKSQKREVIDISNYEL